MSEYLKEGAVELFMTYKFIRLLVTPWKKTEAYEEGVIDAKGKLLIKGKDQTANQKKTYTVWHKLIFNIKRLLEKHLQPPTWKTNLLGNCNLLS